MKESTAIGLMSGSSLDGLDIALVRFQYDGNNYDFSILDADTLPYSDEWKQQLADAFHKQPNELDTLDKAYGKYLGEQVKQFIASRHAKPDFVASHGHTIFHKPEQHYTLQIGDGQALANACGLTVVNDFRTEDVLKGGQGAPLVPIGDKLLFGDYDICLNIGGIANVSYDDQGKRMAYDICMANQALNYLANLEGLPYDKDGALARSGEMEITLLKKLNHDPYYGLFPPKSLGREFFETRQKDLLTGLSTADMLATFTEHIALQIALAVSILPKGKMLVTGGGAKNKFLIERIQARSYHQVVVPDTQIVDYKEALVFALLGLLRMEGRTNVLASVTGAPTDSCSGKIWFPE
ncbi:MAG: anhydro-N-acetylmuramic acid kinase [Bacteroidales bacterium]|nr:anhydro-N-acetylmuramic acid kinase [Bacteroidales bacterium]